MESLCLRLGMRTVARALHAQPDALLAPSLVTCSDTSTADAGSTASQPRMNALEKNWSSHLVQGDLMVLTLAPRHRLRLGQLQIELFSARLLREHHPLDWLRHEDGLFLPLSF